MAEAFRSGQVRCETVVEVKTNGRSAECILDGGRSVLVSGLLHGSISPGDTIEFLLPSEGCDIRTEILVRKAPNSKVKAVYLAPIGYVTRLKEDRRGQLYSLAEVRGSAVGVSAIRLNCDVIRDYFYVARTSSRGHDEPSFYESLKTTPSASLAELRLAYMLRDLELRATRAHPRELKAIERAFNILAEPVLRAGYDALLKDPGAPAVFPYVGFGSLLVEGERSSDGKTFFVRRILAFLPNLCERSFDAPLRKFHFYTDRAIYRVVGINRYPLAPLVLGIDRIEGNRDFAFDVAPDGFERQAEPLAGFLVGGPEIVMPAAFRVRSVGLQGVGPPVDEEAEVFRHDAGGRFETVPPHHFLPHIGWSPQLDAGSGKTKDISRQTATKF